MSVGSVLADVGVGEFIATNKVIIITIILFGVLIKMLWENKQDVEDWFKERGYS